MRSCRARTAEIAMCARSPIVGAMRDLAELTTKTAAQLERDDSSQPSLLELQTKTKAEVEQDDQDWSIHTLNVNGRSFFDEKRND